MTQPVDSTNHRILVVDDDDVLRDTVKEMLELDGFEVSVAVNGRKALDSIAELGLPCFVLLDLMMPVMDGPAFLEHARAPGHPFLNDLPIVVFSALSEASSLGARYQCEVLPKPVSMDLLLSTAERHCPRG